MIADKWPDQYSIPIDSSEYYGKGDGYFHPSTHSLMGERELYYHFHPATCDKMIPERRTLRRQMILATGSALHGVVQTQMKIVKLVNCDCESAVHTCGNIEIEYILPDHHARGRIDFAVDHPNGERYYVEMKTLDIWLYKKLEDIKPEWDAQLSMGEYAMGVDHGIILVMERGGSCDMREFRHRRNDNLLDQIFDKFARVRRAIAENTPPRYCCTYGSLDMKSCPARFQCWLKED